MMNFFNLRFIPLICCFYFYSVESLAQVKNYNTESRIWNEGVVYLSSGEVVEGLVNYNFVVDLVKVDQGGEVKNYIPNNVNAFILKDSAENMHEFVSLPYDMERGSRKVPTFFHKIYQNTHYAILSKHVIGYGRSTPGAGYNNFSITVDLASEKVTQLIFIADRDGNIQQCLEKKKATNLTLKSITVGIGYMPGGFPPYMEPRNGDVGYDKHLKQSVRTIEVERFKISSMIRFQTFFGQHYKAFKKFVKHRSIDLHYLEGLRRGIDFRENR